MLVSEQKFNYLKYISSRQWKKVRKQKISEAGGKCEECGATHRLEVHHLTYKRLCCERMEDLQVLCRDCHDKKHPGKRRDHPVNPRVRRSGKSKRIKRNEARKELRKFLSAKQVMLTASERKRRIGWRQWVGVS